jgi:iron complex outermembrane receptor protein
VPVIRGLSQTVIAAPDRNVALFYNGVFLSNTNVSNFDLLEMERIEVVKGPVSALYGRNAFGGAINYVPRKADPRKGVESTVEATVGSDSRYGVKGSVNLPISDTLAVRLAGGYDQWDGSIKNNYGGKVGGFDATSAAWDIRWKPTEALSIGQFGFYVDDTREQTAQYDYPNNCGQVAGTGTATNPARPSSHRGALKTTEEHRNSTRVPRVLAVTA